MSAVFAFIRQCRIHPFQHQVQFLVEQRDTRNQIILRACHLRVFAFKNRKKKLIIELNVE